MITHHKLKLWVALSELFLATDMQDYTYDFVAKTIEESHFTLEQAEFSLWNEVYPLLESNLTKADGVWEGFGDDYLGSKLMTMKEITSYKADPKIRTTIKGYWSEVVKLSS
jgi:hypothetical protein